MRKTMIIYHANCVDGWCSAWIMAKCFPDAELIPGYYDSGPPPHDGADVYILDFSYPRNVMIEMNENCNSLVVLDHHQTAEERCKDLPFCIFNQHQSGAKMTWDYVHHKKLIWLNEMDRTVYNGMERLVEYVQDRDLWRFKLPNSEVISIALRSYPFDVQTWDLLASRAALLISAIVEEGKAIQRYRDLLIKTHLHHAVPIEIYGHVVPGVPCTALDIASELVGEMAKDRDFAACWCYGSDGYIYFSLRSDAESDECVDVARIAQKYGGGGHANSAGFSIKASALLGVDPTLGPKFEDAKG